jgi:hypothetical protein
MGQQPFTAYEENEISTTSTENTCTIENGRSETTRRIPGIFPLSLQHFVLCLPLSFRIFSLSLLLFPVRLPRSWALRHSAAAGLSKRWNRAGDTQEPEAEKDKGHTSLHKIPSPNSVDSTLDSLAAGKY